MDTNLSQEKTKIPWAQIFQGALDAYLVQLPAPIDIDFGEAGLPTIAHLQHFVVIPLGQAIKDGDFVWGLTLPTIAPRPAHQQEQENPDGKRFATIDERTTQGNSET